MTKITLTIEGSTSDELFEMMRHLLPGSLQQSEAKLDRALALLEQGEKTMSDLKAKLDQLAKTVDDQVSAVNSATELLSGITDQLTEIRNAPNTGAALDDYIGKLSASKDKLASAVAASRDVLKAGGGGATGTEGVAPVVTTPPTPASGSGSTPPTTDPLTPPQTVDASPIPGVTATSGVDLAPPPGESGDAGRRK